MILAALGANDPSFSKEKENKIFVELIVIGVSSVLVIAAVSFISYKPIVALFGF